MDRRALGALAAGLAGLVAGVTGLLLAAPAAGAVAGAASLGAASAALALGGALRTETRRATDARLEAARLASEVYELREARRLAESLAELEALEAGGDEAYIDEPTGLLDGRYFQPALQNRVAAARRLLRPVSVVLLEIDDPACSDAVLRSFAGVVRDTLREADTACRLDGNRFGVILEDTPEGGGVWAAERIRAGFARDGGAVHRLSAGVAAYPSHALEADDLLTRAERALGRARSTGRGQVEIAATD